MLTLGCYWSAVSTFEMPFVEIVRTICLIFVLCMIFVPALVHVRGRSPGTSAREDVREREGVGLFLMVRDGICVVLPAGS